MPNDSDRPSFPSSLTMHAQSASSPKSAVTLALPNTDGSNPQSPPQQLIAGVLRPLPPMEDHTYPPEISKSPPIVETQPSTLQPMVPTSSTSPTSPNFEPKQPKKLYMGDASTLYVLLVSCVGIICCCFMPDDSDHCCNKPWCNQSSSSSGCGDCGGPCGPCSSGCDGC